MADILQNPRDLKAAKELYDDWRTLAIARRQIGREHLIAREPDMTVRLLATDAPMFRIDRLEAVRLMDIELNRLAAALRKLNCQWPELDGARVVVSMPASPEGDE